MFNIGEKVTVTEAGLLNFLDKSNQRILEGIVDSYAVSKKGISYCLSINKHFKWFDEKEVLNPRISIEQVKEIAKNVVEKKLKEEIDDFNIKYSDKGYAKDYDFKCISGIDTFYILKYAKMLNLKVRITVEENHAFVEVIRNA